ncbi:MAG: 3-methyl-2-oxobutanoate hydroxymethyltransferase [Anaerolineales bacterium]|nr:3-methyl-2-oxobutanoate hydroxymethyltransferase [Anaerolineales bacterium]
MSPTPPLKRRKITTRAFQQKKQHKEPITMLTAYDYAIARAVDEVEIDAILVGDSVGMVVLGYETTLPVTMADMLHHCKAVARGASYALLIGDMPFMSYQAAVEEAVRNAGRFLQEAGMDAIKLEGGRERIPAIRAILEAGIPVMGHLGLTPQSVHQFGGFRAQGLTADRAVQIYTDALELQEVGCFAIVLESIPARLARRISEKLAIPTIGIGAGVGCDGQVLVVHDVLGLFDRFVPRFVKQYADLWTTITGALQTYAQEVRTAAFPGDEHILQMPDDEWEAFLNAVE